MNILQFLFLLGVINIVFGFLWNWVVALLGAILFTAIKFESGILILKAFGAYLLVSITALTTLLAIQNSNSGWEVLLFSIVGAFVLFMGFAQNVYEQRKQASMNYDYYLLAQLERNTWFDLLLMSGSVILFVLILFFPVLSTNSLNIWLFNLFLWVYKLPVIGWILSIGGALFMLNMIWYGFITVIMISGSFYSKFNLTTRENDISKKKESEIKE